MAIGGCGWRCGRRWARACGPRADLVLPSRCAACHGPGAPLCGAVHRCRASGIARGVAPVAVGPRPPPPGMPVCRAGARFEGALRLAVTAYKDEGRRDLRDDLGRLLAGALAAATRDPGVRRRLALGEEVLVVPVPTSRASRRRRGDDPVGELATAAVAAVNGAGPRASRRATPGRHVARAAGLVVVHALVHTRRVADQAHLDRRARADNLAGRWRCASAVARGRRGSHLRGGRRRRHDRRDARRGGPRAARRRCPARGRGDVRHHTSPRPDPALVAHRPSD